MGDVLCISVQRGLCPTVLEGLRDGVPYLTGKTMGWRVEGGRWACEEGVHQ